MAEFACKQPTCEAQATSSNFRKHDVDTGPGAWTRSVYALPAVAAGQIVQVSYIKVK